MKYFFFFLKKKLCPHKYVYLLFSSVTVLLFTKTVIKWLRQFTKVAGMYTTHEKTGILCLIF